MNVGSELEKLNNLRLKGVLTDAEFAVAKSKLLSELSKEGTVDSGVHLLGSAASKYVNLKIATFIVAAVLATVFFFTFFLPQWQKIDRDFDEASLRRKQFSDQVNKEISDRQIDFNKKSEHFDKEYEKASKEIDDFKRKNGFK